MGVKINRMSKKASILACGAVLAVFSLATLAVADEPPIPAKIPTKVAAPPHRVANSFCGRGYYRGRPGEICKPYAGPQAGGLPYVGPPDVRLPYAELPVRLPYVEPLDIRLPYFELPVLSVPYWCPQGQAYFAGHHRCEPI